MPKKPKKVSIVSRRKRPKSIYAKGWETRRLRAQGIAANTSINNAGLGPTNVQTTGLATQFPSNGAKEVSGGDALLHMSLIHRDEQLCCFVADMASLRSHGMPLHAPIMLTRTQAEAIEEFLIDHGYSMWGKGSGLFASVSTKPNAEKAA